MAEAHLRVLVTGDRGLYSQRRAQLLALGVGVVLVRDPARAAERFEAIARCRIGRGQTSMPGSQSFSAGLCAA